ncbi:MAG: hypothetical protein A2152_01580 [Candidatus Levybacteria bacterium RBG_16_35_6]|nr:MAG: hypothetical protein A2152_01580 [Candidatus Levybacteria bacterium RBG_16_35_6]
MQLKEIASDIKVTFSKENLLWYTSVMSFHTLLARSVIESSRGEKSAYSLAFLSLMFWTFSNTLAKERYLALARRTFQLGGKVPIVGKVASLTEKNFFTN